MLFITFKHALVEVLSIIAESVENNSYPSDLAVDVEPSPSSKPLSGSVKHLRIVCQEEDLIEASRI